MRVINLFSLYTCSASTKQLVDQYEEQRQGFMSSVTVNEFRKMFLTSATGDMLSAEMVPVKLKLDNDWDEETLDDLIKLASRLFKVPGSLLHLSKVEEGCIAVTWGLCPTADIKDLEIAIKESTDSLQTNGVLQVFVREDLMWECSQPKTAGDQCGCFKSILLLLIRVLSQ